MQRAIGRSTGSSDDAGSIFKCFTCADITRANVAFDQGHDLPTRSDGDVRAVGIGSWHHIAVRQRKPDGLTHTGHRIGRELAAAGAVAGARDLFKRCKARKRTSAGGIAAHCFEHVDDGDILVLKGPR